MKRVLLTGASGFIGRACVAPLQARGYDIHTVSRAPKDVPAGVIAHQGDLLDRDRLHGLLAAIGPSHLLHAAWDVSHNAYWTARNNLTWLAAGVDLLDAFIAAGGQRAVGVGSCAEYEWNDTLCRETTSPLLPATPYGAAKLALCHAFGAAGGLGLETAWGRIFFAYGAGEKQGRLLPSVINGLLEGREVECTEGRQVRDFIHIDDVGGALAALLDGGVTGSVNIGTGAGVAMRDVIDEVVAQLGHGELVRFGALPTRPGDPSRLVGDAHRLVGEVGFTPSVTLSDGVARSIAHWQVMQRRVH